MTEVKIDNTKWRGFASLSVEERIAVSRKGGSRKVPKGFARFTPDERIENGKRAYQIKLSKKLGEQENGNITTKN